jgi:hypothetical protein
MDAKYIRKKIEEAKELVKDVEEPFRMEAFKIIFTKLINDEKFIDTSTNSTVDPISVSNQHSNPISKLASYCNVKEDEMRNIIDFENGQFILLKKIEGSTIAEKQINASLCILTAWAKGMDVPWISSEKLGDSLRELSIDTAHLGENLTPTQYFSLKGKRRAAKYHITTQGWQKGTELLKYFLKTGS